MSDSRKEQALRVLPDEAGIVVGTEAPQFAGEAPRGPHELSVQIAYCHEPRVSHSFHSSLLSMMAFDKSIGSNLLGASPFMVSCSGPRGLIEGRNLAVSHFLDETELDWLFWIDTDMGFEPNALERLLAAADPADRPVVGGLCFAFKQMRADGYSGFRFMPVPTLFGLARDQDGRISFVNKSMYPPNTMVQVAGTGAAFVLIHRRVLEDIRAKYGDEWYSPISYENGKEISEDLSFCWRVTDLMHPIYVHTGVATTHHKDIYIGPDDYDMPDTDPIFQNAAPKMVIEP